MSEIKYPSERTYYVARDAQGLVLHVGYTDPDQVTTTGQYELIAGSILEQIGDLAQFIGQPQAFNMAFDPETRSWVFPEGDHIYVPVDPRLIEQLSRGLYALIDPDRPGLYAGIIWHPENAAWPVLQLRGEDVVPISLAANADPLSQVLEAFVQGGGLTAEEHDGIVGAVGSQAGKVVRIADMIPPSWQPYIMDRASVEALGYFR